MQRDIGQFASAKLQGGWSAADFGKHLTRDGLRTLLQRFDKLEPLVRARLLLACALLEEGARAALQPELESLLAAAREDKDEWVNLTAKALGGLSAPLDLAAVRSASAVVRNTLADLEQRLSVQEPGNEFRPTEEAYLSTSLLVSLRTDLQPEPEQTHFRPREGASLAGPSKRPHTAAQPALSPARAAQRSPLFEATAEPSSRVNGGAGPAPDAAPASHHAVPSGAASSQTKSGVGVDDMFRSSRPSTLLGSRPQPAASASHSERRGEARPRLVKVLDAEAMGRLGRPPSPEPSQSAAARPAEPEEEPEEGELL